MATAIDDVVRRLGMLDGELDGVAPDLRKLATGLDALRALEINGRIESARIQNVGGLEALFADIAGRAERAGAQVDELRTLAAEGSSHGLPAARERLRPHIERLHAVGASAGARQAA